MRFFAQPVWYRLGFKNFDIVPYIVLSCLGIEHLQLFLFGWSHWNQVQWTFETCKDPGPRTAIGQGPWTGAVSSCNQWDWDIFRPPLHSPYFIYIYYIYISNYFHYYYWFSFFTYIYTFFFKLLFLSSCGFRYAIYFIPMRCSKVGQPQVDPQPFEAPGKPIGVRCSFNTVWQPSTNGCGSDKGCYL